MNVCVIDVFDATLNHPEWYSDGVHLNAAGYSVFANKVYCTLKGQCPCGVSTQTFTSTPTTTPTITPTPTPTSTATITSTVTETPVPNNNLAFPNPWEGNVPLSFYHTVPANTDRVTVKLFTLAFRKVYENSGLDTSQGQHLVQLDWNKVGNIANGLYYLVVVDGKNGKTNISVMKLLIRR